MSKVAAGTKLFIGGVAASNKPVLADFTAATWLQVRKLKDFGEMHAAASVSSRATRATA